MDRYDGVMNDFNLTAENQDRVYILRLWRAESPDWCWRASLENPRTGTRLGFDSLERLFAFLIGHSERDAVSKQGGKDGNLTTS